MTRLPIVLMGAVSLTLAACSSNNQDAVTNAQTNQAAEDNLNGLSNAAAGDAAMGEAATLGDQQRQLEQQAPANADSNMSGDNTQNPADADEQNVSGM